MKYLNVIQYEFVKEARKWEELNEKEQREYLKKHPKSKRRIVMKRKKVKVDDVKKYLSSDYNNWKEFVDSQEMGDCQGIAHDIARRFGLKRVFGEIDVDEPYIDDDGEEQNKVTHHWIEMNGDIYDFAKGSLSDYVEFMDKYDPEVDDESVYHVINKEG